LIDRLVMFVAAAARAGVDMIQLRERDLEGRELLMLTERCVHETARRTRIFVNERLDVALPARADGVHLRSDSVDAPRLRQLVPSDFSMGRSVHGTAEAVEAARLGGLDYLIFGSVFPTSSKPVDHTASGVNALAEVCASVPLPVLAIGGVTRDRIDAVVRSGAAGIAAIGLFIPPGGGPFDRHLADTVEMLRRAFDTCGAVP
jgi:thiamine-phosphate pyrophosphorylase